MYTPRPRSGYCGIKRFAGKGEPRLAQGLKSQPQVVRTRFSAYDVETQLQEHPKLRHRQPRSRADIAKFRDP